MVALVIGQVSVMRRASQVALVVKNPPANAGDVRDMFLSQGWENPLQEGMATHCSILAWRVPWTEEPGGLQPTESQRAGHDWSDLARTHRSCIWNPAPRNSHMVLDPLTIEGIWRLTPCLPQKRKYLLN